MPVELIVMVGDVLECGKLGCVGCGCANSKLSEGEVCWLPVVNNFFVSTVKCGGKKQAHDSGSTGRV